VTEDTSRLRVRWRLALGGVAVLLLAGSPFWAPLVLRRMSFFRLRRVEIVGTHYILPSEILARLHVDTMASVWAPPGPLERRVAAHPQVRSVTITRKLPGTLVVEITERMPVALFATPQGFRAYDERGVALPIDPARTPVDAPVVVERDALLFHLLARMRRDAPAMFDRVSEVRRVGRDELLLQLPSESVRAMADVTLNRLAEIEPVENDLARRQLHAAEIDLRYRDQVIARLP
jgi:cell division protein FtsQ